ncbi:hypothetical protein ACEPAH_7515 [Sanghuangporus vaninii]
MITLYDIPSQLPDKVWSPNTFKSRISLNYKGIPYKTEWVEYPDIESTLKQIGGAPTGKWSDGRDYYSLPAIHDSATGKVIVDSARIAAYLDETYPDKPVLYPPSSKAATAVLDHVVGENFSVPIRPINLPAAHKILNPPSQVYFRTTREKMSGKKLEDFAPPGPVRDAVWKTVKEGLDRLADFYERNGEDKLYYFGDTFSFADTIVIGYLLWTKIVLGADSDEWKMVASWNKGRWERLIESTKHLQTVK